MSTESSAADRQRKINEFLQILPLTTAIAGLPSIEPHKHLNEGQMEVRANALKTAYKIARGLLLDISK